MSKFNLPPDLIQPATHRDVVSLIRALPIIVRAMTDNAGIKVMICRGAGIGWTTQDTLAIEAFPLPRKGADPAELERILTLYMGGIDHEVGHHRHSRMAWSVPLLQSLPDLQRGLVKIIEDPRMEHMMAAEFPGSDRNLRQLSALLLEEGVHTAVEDTDPAATVLTYWCLYWLRRNLRQEYGFSELASDGEAVMRRVFGDDLTDAIKAELSRMLTATSVEDSFDVATAIYGLIQSASQQQADDPGHDGEESAESGEDTDDNGLDASNDATASQDGDTPDGDSSPDEGAQNTGGAIETSTDEDAANSENGTTVPANTGNVGDSPASAPPTSGNSARAAQEAINGSHDDMCQDTGELVSQSIAEELEELQSDQQIELDRNETGMDSASAGGSRLDSPSDYDAVNPQDVKGVSARVRQRLIARTQAQARVSSSHRGRGHYLDASVLHRVAVGDGRVFLDHREEKGNNTAMFLLLDVSGSMQDEDRIVVAREALLATAIAADMVPGLSLAAGVFPNERFLKRFGEPARACAREFGIKAIGRNTPLHEGVLFAARALSRRTEPRRMLVIASDGQPDSVSKAMINLDMVRAMGVEIFGLGINTDMAKLIPGSRNLRTVAELPQVLFGLLDKATFSRVA